MFGHELIDFLAQSTRQLTVLRVLVHIGKCLMHHLEVLVGIDSLLADKCVNYLLPYLLVIPSELVGLMAQIKQHSLIVDDLFVPSLQDVFLEQSVK